MHPYYISTQHLFKPGRILKLSSDFWELTKNVGILIYYVSNHQAAQVEIMSMKNDALRAMQNKLKHNLQQKRGKGKISYEVCGNDKRFRR